ncbi:hypothetical protein ACU063_20900 [Paenibacillus sp. M.A.Huq-81]
MQTLLIKHAVSGRTFFDSRREDVSYLVEESGDGWLFRIEHVQGDTAEAVNRFKAELNVFIFKEFEDEPVLKTWYYVQDGPVHYDEEQRELCIYAGSKIEYYPHHYSQ